MWFILHWWKKPALSAMDKTKPLVVNPPEECVVPLPGIKERAATSMGRVHRLITEETREDAQAETWEDAREERRGMLMEEPWTRAEKQDQQKENHLGQTPTPTASQHLTNGPVQRGAREEQPLELTSGRQAGRKGVFSTCLSGSLSHLFLNTQISN